MSHRSDLDGKDTDLKTYRIRNYDGEYQDVTVDDELYEELLRMDREADRIRHKEVYHCTNMQLDMFEDMTACQYTNITLNILIRKEEKEKLYEAISTLTPTQQRRVRMFMDNMSITEIARLPYHLYRPYASLKCLKASVRSLISPPKRSFR